MVRGSLQSRMPIFARSCPSSSLLGFGVVSKRSPRKTEFAPARKHSAWPSSESSSRPAESRTIEGRHEDPCRRDDPGKVQRADGRGFRKRSAGDADEAVDRHALRMRVLQDELMQQAPADLQRFLPSR